MKNLTFLFILAFSITLSPAYGQSFRELEIIINQSSMLSAKCAPRTCTLSPRQGVSSQNFDLEVFWMKRHLDELGVTLKEDRNGLPRQK